MFTIEDINNIDVTNKQTSTVVGGRCLVRLLLVSLILKT